MARKILVIGNCQIGGIASALSRILNSDNVYVTPFNPQTHVNVNESLRQELLQSDIVVGNDHVENYIHKHKLVVRKFIKIPRFRFSAFHPDMVYAKKKSTGEFTRINYNSAITVWAFMKGLDPSDVVGLFNGDTFMKLGYFDVWYMSEQAMRLQFEGCGLNFDKFFLAIKREGVFMHTMNHPKVSVLVLLAKLVALRIGVDEPVWRKEICISDALLPYMIWPVYPEIAYNLAVPGSYSWTISENMVNGVREYVEVMYAEYKNNNILPDDIEMIGVDQAAYDSVLSQKLKGV